jgi:two-component system chemotaxis sensor kinase CheA
MDPSTLQELPVKPNLSEGLRQDLNALSQKAIQADIKEIDQALELALGFEAWTGRARELKTSWGEGHHLQAQEFARQLKKGQSPDKVMEKFLRLLLQTHRLLEQEKPPKKSLGPKEKETDPPASFHLHPSSKAPAVPIPAPRPGQMAVRPEDQGFFEIFLLDAPSRLEEAQSRLAEITPEKRGDVSPLYRCLLDLRSRFGFLGFLRAWRLGQDLERLLDPLMGGHRAMSGEMKDGISQALSFFRAQVGQVEEGLPVFAVTVLDPTELMGKLQALPLPPPLAGDRPQTETDPDPVSFPAFRNPGALAQKLDDLNGKLLEWNQAQNLVVENYRSQAPPQAMAQVARLQKAALQLREGFLSLEMAPVESLLSQSARWVETLSARRNRPVELNVEGAEVEIDQKLLPELKEPLFCLIQNALEHGFEGLPERRSRGKKDPGTLTLRASKKEGAFLLDVEDDGRGLDLEEIRRKALELQWIQDEEIPPSRLVELIFTPGFSRKDGGEYGKGLDLVRLKMESLLGSVRVQNLPGQGCRFTLKVPRSLALMEGWVVEAGGQRYLIPLAQTLKIEAAQSKKTSGQEPLVPEIPLASRLEGAADPREGAIASGGKLIVWVESGFRQARLRVEEVWGKQPVLVKKNQPENPPPPGLRAEALFQDGSTGWILDIAALIREADQGISLKE